MSSYRVAKVQVLEVSMITHAHKSYFTVSELQLQLLFDVVDSNRPSSPRLGRGKAKTVLIFFACAFVKGKGTGKKDEKKTGGNNGKKEKNYKPSGGNSKRKTTTMPSCPQTCTGGNVVRIRYALWHRIRSADTVCQQRYGRDRDLSTKQGQDLPQTDKSKDKSDGRRY
eukprot:g4271.t1